MPFAKAEGGDDISARRLDGMIGAQQLDAHDSGLGGAVGRIYQLREPVGGLDGHVGMQTHHVVFARGGEGLIERSGQPLAAIVPQQTDPGQTIEVRGRTIRRGVVDDDEFPVGIVRLSKNTLETSLESSLFVVHGNDDGDSRCGHVGLASWSRDPLGHGT